MLGSAMRRPPEVSAERPFNKRKFGPMAPAESSFIPAMTGRVSKTKSTSAFCMAARFFACPRKPNPVMSVAPWAPCFFMRIAAALFRVAMESSEMVIARRAASSSMMEDALAHFSSYIIHTWRFPATWVPRGLVSTRMSSGTTAVEATILLLGSVAITAPPRIGQGLSTVWPPVTGTPASSQASWKPLTICSVTIRRCAGSMAVEHPRIISMLFSWTQPAA
mmetsp:Transcript_41837/g.89809  ORF Transcript_41837/g.89809 Transcript_41837/m.89809 type:complete len:221 (+) Transcript_41837:205-867(+)